MVDAEKLIECVKTRSILYECTKKSYRDVTKKESAWADVAVEMGEGVTGMSSRRTSTYVKAKNGAVRRRAVCEWGLRLFIGPITVEIWSGSQGLPF